MKKIRFIVNPISGTNGKRAVVDMIPKYFAAPDFHCEVKYTEYGGHASQLSEEAVEQGFDVVVAIGGDGTVNEVASSLVHTPAALGIIPCGSGNGLARHLGIPLSHVKAMKILRQMNIQKLDYGRINNNYFFCTCGVGFDAFVSEKFAQSNKRGVLTYIENTLREGLKYQPETYELEVDGERQQYKAFLIACGNASQYGNNAYITPEASMNDGLMDVTIMEPFNIIEAPQIALQLFTKTITENNHIHTYRCKNLKIFRQQSGVVHYDGDPIVCDKDLEIKLVEKGINIVANSEGKAAVPPLLRVFTDIYTGITDEVQQIGRDINNTNNHIKKINQELLNRLRG